MGSQQQSFYVRNKVLFSFAIFLVVTGSALAQEKPFPDEMKLASGWLQDNWLSAKVDGQVPFSFLYGGRSSASLLPGWKKEMVSKKLDGRRTAFQLTWSDLASGLLIRCDAIQYQDFPTVEWTLHVKNTGIKPSPILENFQALDTTFIRNQNEEFILHHQTGDNCSAHSYEPHETRLGPKVTQGFAPDGGRPTNGRYPFFNLAYDGGGLIIVVGWPGQWAARFQRDENKGLRISAGQQLTHFTLLPGEEVRSPLVVLQFWKGDRIQSQNIWRRWMIAHNLPRPGGILPQPFTSTCMGLHQSAAGEIGFIDAFLKNGVKFDYWWMDAGWYPCREWWQVGTWRPDPKRFPKGIKEVADHAHGKGSKLILWFEPERVHAGSWLFENHPEWLLGKTGDNRLLNLGNPEVRTWLTNHIDKFLVEQGIDLYRQDFNIDPLGFWRASDQPDRQGITEIRYVEGYLAFWDELLRRHPGMLIDSCASGGRRNDLETLRRSVPLLRSDFQQPQNPSAADMLVGNQGHTYGLSFWVPYYGTGIGYENVYAVRSHLTPFLGIGGDPHGKLSWPKFHRRIEEWKKVASCFYGDYYPLTPYSLAESTWIAWQFHRPETGEGMIQAFRRSRCPEPQMTFKLAGLERDAIYQVADLDLEGFESGDQLPGHALLDHGLCVDLPRRQQAALFHYKRLSGLAAVISTTPGDIEVSQKIEYSGKNSQSPKDNITEYHWDLGDGTQKNGPVVEHVYKNPGNYVVTLRIKNSLGKMASTIRRISVTPLDSNPPNIAEIGSGDPKGVTIVFNRPVEQTSAENPANYTVDHGIKVLAASMQTDPATVRLVTSPLLEDKTYTLSICNIRDRARVPHTIAPNTQRAFQYSGLYGWWKLDEGQGEKAADSSGNQFHGSLLGGRKGPTWVKTERGKALYFSGDGEFLETESFLPDLTMPFSIALWVNPAETQVEYADILGNHGEPYVGINIQQDQKKTNVFGFGYGNGKRWQGVGPVQLQAKQWQHLGIVCDNEYAILYLNGTEVRRMAAKGPVAPNPNQNFKLGQGYHSGRYFHGMLSDVRIYRMALTPAQIAALAKGSGK